VKTGVFDGMPEVVRYSTVLRRLREAGDATAIALERLKAQVGTRCPTHGALEDPIVAIVDAGPRAQVAFGCPWCSGDQIRELWEREGAEAAREEGAS
jgi:hypothetical protein